MHLTLAAILLLLASFFCFQAIRRRRAINTIRKSPCKKEKWLSKEYNSIGHDEVHLILQAICGNLLDDGSLCWNISPADRLSKIYYSGLFTPAFDALEINEMCISIRKISGVDVTKRIQDDFEKITIGEIFEFIDKENFHKPGYPH